MIFLYYTGAITPGAPQPEARKSLGGFISGTQIPNSRMNSLFKDISMNAGDSETICIVAKNAAPADLTNFKLFCDIGTETSYTVSAAVVLPSEDECGEKYFEKIENSESLPYYGEYHSITGSANTINMGTFAKGSYIGIFLTKTKLTPPVDPQNPVDPCTPIDFESQVEADTVITTILNFSWD